MIVLHTLLRRSRLVLTTTTPDLSPGRHRARAFRHRAGHDVGR